MMSNPVLYVFVNTDLDSMNMGKAMAQASHAANAFVHRFYYEYECEESNTLATEWVQSTAQGFGTQLCMKSDNFEADYTDLQEGWKWTGECIDPTYPFEVTKEVFNLLDMNKIVDFSVRKDKVVCTRRERTAFYVFGDRDDTTFRELMKPFKLHP